ncbi:hypothetical protein BC834DRAFT_325343 [Gloeopeniophorella convolvens]|nr:hypothetical protein BC834DRAFT_325343 [Gloeopeniophorella convolvens]
MSPSPGARCPMPDARCPMPAPVAIRPQVAARWPSARIERFTSFIVSTTTINANVYCGRVGKNTAGYRWEGHCSRSIAGSRQGRQ